MNEGQCAPDYATENTGLKVEAEGETFPGPGHGSNLVLSLQQLVSSVNTMLRTSPTTASFEDVLAHLEATDENFHSYEFVRLLQRRIDGVVGPLVESRVEERPFEGDGHAIVAQITDEVFLSTEYSQLYQSFVSEVKAAVNEMLVDDSVLMSSPDGVTGTSSRSSATQYYNLDDSAASGLSFVNQTGLMFMSPDQLQAIADRLTPSQPVEIRLDAMQCLLQFPAGDLVTCDNWPSLRTAMGHTLMDTDSTLAALSLKLHWCMFAAHTALTTREVYLTLSEKLREFFQSEEGCVVMLAMGLDPADDRCLKLLARFRLLSHFQNEVPSYWVRYNERIVDEIVSSTFSLLSLSYSTPTLLGPAHFLALLDPKASWFRKWMHGQYSRTKVLREIKARPTFLQGVVSHILGFKIKSGVKVRRPQPANSGYYNERALNYIHFVHSLCLLERLLLYEGGRQLFPLKLPGRGKVTVTDFLVHILHMMYSLSPPTTGANATMPTEQRTFDPILLIAHLLKEVASGNALCRQTLCSDVFISALTAALKCAMGSTTSPRVSDEALVLLADVLAVLASTDNGRHHLLHGQDQPRWTHNKSAPVHTIAEFVVHSLSSKGPPIAPQVTSAWLFVCRQLYNTGEGLMCLEPYQLHMHIARAWKRSAEGVRAGGTFPWEEALTDNLLNFAGTPKGLLLLQQSGLMADCTQYMHHRYKLKLQVSKCEKFGYGCMVTQLASTAAGILELSRCGFVAMLVDDLWTLLDGGEGDYRLTAPRTHPLDPMDRASHKAVVNLLNILSSFAALHEVLNQATPTTVSPWKRDSTPSTVFSSLCERLACYSSVKDLLDHLVLVDSEPKRSALLNYLEAHHFGLRILSVLVTCLDSFLYLETQYSFLEALLTLQRDSRRDSRGDTREEEGGEIIIDACSVERNRILVSCYFVGGPNERKLPPHFLIEPSDSYTWPLFSSYPAPLQYQPQTHAPTVQSESELYRFLNQVPPAEGSSWLSQLRELYCSEVVRSKSLPNDLIALLLQRCVSAQTDNKGDVSFPHPQTSDPAAPHQPSSMDHLGATLVIRYGQYLGLLDKSVSHIPSLTSVLSQTRSVLACQQHARRPTPLCTLNGEYVGFDWFAASIFLLMKGSLKKTWDYLKLFSTLLLSGYLWIPRLHLSVHLPAEIAYSGIHPVTYVTAHFMELILQSEVPLVYSAFRMSGYTPSQICQHWVRQCFWNFLDWPEVCLYFTTCTVMGTDYQVYFCVAVLKYLEPAILEHTQGQSLLVFLKEECLQGFHCADWLQFMQNLESKFRNIVLEAMKQFS